MIMLTKRLSCVKLCKDSRGSVDCDYVDKKAVLFKVM